MRSADTVRGFTLVELLLAMSISSLVLVGAVMSMSLVAEANGRINSSLEHQVNINRALTRLMQDVYYASSIDSAGDRVVLEYPSGAAVVYEIAADKTELHRITGASRSAAETAADALNLPSLAAVSLTDHGLIQDSDYRASAVIQGVDKLVFRLLEDPAKTVNLGLHIEVDYYFDDVLHVATSSGLLLNVAESVRP